MAFNFVFMLFLTIIGFAIDGKTTQGVTSSPQTLKSSPDTIKQAPEIVEPELKTLYERVAEDFKSDAKADSTYSTEQTFLHEHLELIKGML